MLENCDSCTLFNGDNVMTHDEFLHILELGEGKDCAVCLIVRTAYDTYRTHVGAKWTDDVAIICVARPRNLSIVSLKIAQPHPIQRTGLRAKYALNKPGHTAIGSVLVDSSRDTFLKFAGFGNFEPADFDDPDQQVNRQLRHARWFLEKCESGHKMCSSRGQVLPRRLLDLATTDSSGADSIRSVGREQLAPDARYACLSHCWGQSRPLRLLKENVDEFRQGISVGALPKTFADAVKVCRALNIRYIWIDSLCIVQDDDQDWKEQAEIMGVIYSGAFLTIAATCAPGSDQGFLNRPVNAVYPKTVGGQDLLFYATSLCYKAYGSAPLNRRAWTAQESMLSPRVLKFFPSEVAWECAGADSCQCFVNRGPSRGDMSSPAYDAERYTMALQPRRLLLDLLQRDTHQRQRGAWRMIVSNFLDRGITFDRDRTFAFTGILEIVTAETEQSVHAWHLRQPDSDISFFEDLMWASSEQARRSSVRRAPSWSIASIEHTQVIYRDDLQISDSELGLPRIVGLDCPSNGILGSEDPLAGALRMDCRLLPGKVFADVVTPRNQPPTHRFGIMPDGQTLDQPVGTVRFAPPLQFNEGGPEAIDCVFVFLGIKVQFRNRLAFYLICVPSSSAPGAYERIGDGWAVATALEKASKEGSLLEPKSVAIV